VTGLRTLAPGKVNLCLFLGQTRADRRHELVTVFESVSLVDSVSLSPADGGLDTVECPGVSGPNLALEALAALRARGWEGPPVRVEIAKQIPVAAGMGGGSSDAAAVLLLAAELAPIEPDALAEIAASLGADVPSQLHPGLSLGTGAGEIVEPLAPLAPHAFVIVPLPFALSTPAVYAEADRLALPRAGDDLAARLAAVRAALRPGAELAAELLVNDLQPAAHSLCPAIGGALQALREAGAEHAFVSGSGPTCVGLWWGGPGAELVAGPARRLAGRFPGASALVPFER
jgi:4-diphosphocytidyl-2-C-methyl-D-erythritol kinase